MYAGKVELCGVDTSQLPVLSESEKSALIRAARAGNSCARQKMIQGNGCLSTDQFVDENGIFPVEVRFQEIGLFSILHELRNFAKTPSGDVAGVQRAAK